MIHSATILYTRIQVLSDSSDIICCVPCVSHHRTGNGGLAFLADMYQVGDIGLSS